MTLSDRKILERLNNGSIIIEPFDKRNLATSSYDVCLGKYYYTERPPSHGRVTSIYDIYSEQQTKRVWGDFLEAEVAETLLPEYLKVLEGIHKSERIILLAP